MELSVIVFCYNKSYALKEFEEKIFAINNNCEIIYLTKHGRVLETTQKYYCFSENNEDKMLNSIFNKINGKNTLIIRENYDLKNIDKIEEMLTDKRKADIILCKNNNNKFVAFCKKLYNKINNFIFNYTLFDGDLSIMYFGNNPTAVLKAIKNPSVYIKTNHFVGMKILYIDNNTDMKYMPNDSIGSEIAKVSVSFGITMLFIILLATVNALKGFFGTIMFLLLIGLSSAYFAISIWRFITILFVGKFENATIDYEEN